MKAAWGSQNSGRNVISCLKSGGQSHKTEEPQIQLYYYSSYFSCFMRWVFIIHSLKHIQTQWTESAPTTPQSRTCKIHSPPPDKRDVSLLRCMTRRRPMAARFHVIFAYGGA